MNRIIHEKIHYFINNRLALQKEIRSLFDIDEWAFVPPNGEVSVDEQPWIYKKHGLGVLFQNNKGIKIDIQNVTINENYFTRWELAEYFRSLGNKFIRKNFDSSVDKFIENEILKIEYIASYNDFLYLI